MNVEELVEPGDLEDLEDLRINVRELELALLFLDAFLQGDEHAQGSAGEVLHVAETEEQIAALTLHKLVQLFLNLVDAHFVEDLAIRELDQGDSRKVPDFDS